MALLARKRLLLSAHGQIKRASLVHIRCAAHVVRQPRGRVDWPVIILIGCCGCLVKHRAAEFVIIICITLHVTDYSLGVEWVVEGE
jgi:hypothetical protein